MSTAFATKLNKPKYKSLGQEPRVTRPNRNQPNKGAIPLGTNQIIYRLVRGTVNLYDVKYLGTGKSVKVRDIVLPFILSEARAKRIECLGLK